MWDGLGWIFASADGSFAFFLLKVAEDGSRACAWIGRSWVSGVVFQDEKGCQGCQMWCGLSGLTPKFGM